MNDLLTPCNGRLLGCLFATCIALAVLYPIHNGKHLFALEDLFLQQCLRLAGACTLEQANEVVQAYLPRLNAQFAIEATSPVLAYRLLPQSVNAETVFCFKYVRTVALDNTVSLGEQCVPLLPGKERHSYARTQVEIHERFDGSLAVYYGTHCVATTPTLPQTPVLRARKGRRATPQATSLQAERTVDETARQPTSAGEREQTAASRTRPAANHPWRKPLLPRKQTQARVQSTAKPCCFFAFHQVQEKRGHAMRSPVKAGSL